MTNITECEQLVAQSETVTYKIIAECYAGTSFVIPHQGCYRVSAITPDGESDLSAPTCSCNFSPATVTVCNTSQTATCTPPQTGTPVTIPAGAYCVVVNDDPSSIAAAQANMNAAAMAQAQSELVCSGPPPPGSLFAYYKMDETPSGTRADSVGSNPLKEAVLIFFPDTVFSSVGIINNGADFTGDLGDRSYLVTDSATAFSFPGSFSVSFWIFPRDPGGSEQVLTANGLQIEANLLNPGQLRMVPFMRTPGPTFVPLAQFDMPFDTWGHIVLTWDATIGQAKVYRNGVLNSTQGGIAALDTAPLFMRVGGSDGGVGVNTFAGHADELGWWTKVLTLAEATALYNGGAGLALGSPGFPS